jgi:hypothetical protein
MKLSDWIQSGWKWPALIVGALTAYGIWALVDDARHRTPEIPAFPCGRYQTIHAWEDETGHRYVIDVSPREIRITHQFDGVSSVLKVLKVASCLSTRGGGFVATVERDNTAYLRPHGDVEGLKVFGFTDLFYVGETPDGYEHYDDHGVHDVPVERVR